ncbi:MAG: Txe/YoeB family addiction module toxin [Gammaproteobacteria bacterium]
MRGSVCGKRVAPLFGESSSEDPCIHKRVNPLIEGIGKVPFRGIGKPEPLKHEWAGYWSRRITEEHRLVYKVAQGKILIAACRYHYGK